MSEVAGWAERALQGPPLLEWMAWRRYLIVCRASTSASYLFVEDAAWHRLREELARIEAPRSPRPQRVLDPVGRA